MNLRNLAVLFCRCMAILALIDAAQVFSYLGSLRGDIDAFGIFGFWIRLLFAEMIHIVYAFILWFFAEEIAGWMIRNLEERDALPNISMEQLQTMVFSCIGIYVLYETLMRVPWFLFWGFRNYIQSGFWTILEQALTILIGLGVGAGLLLGAPRLVEWLKSWHKVGADRRGS